MHENINIPQSLKANRTSCQLFAIFNGQNEPEAQTSL